MGKEGQTGAGVSVVGGPSTTTTTTTTTTAAPSGEGDVSISKERSSERGSNSRGSRGRGGHRGDRSGGGKGIERGSQDARREKPS